MKHAAKHASSDLEDATLNSFLIRYVKSLSVSFIYFSVRYVMSQSLCKFKPLRIFDQ